MTRANARRKLAVNFSLYHATSLNDREYQVIFFLYITVDKDFIITTPKEITQQINNFCLEIEPAINPIFVPVKPVDSARYNYCLTDVPVYSQKHGGSVQFGWIIWELKNIWIEAEFHACWINNDT